MIVSIESLKMALTSICFGLLKKHLLQLTFNILSNRAEVATSVDDLAIYFELCNIS